MAENPYVLGLPAYRRMMAAQQEQQVPSPQPVNSLGYWTQRAGNAGLEVRNALLDAGIAMSPADKKVLGEQKIMERAQMDLAEAVKGGFDPLAAQEMALNTAIAQFMSLGNFEAAEGLTGKLVDVRKAREEILKLKTEQEENVAQATSAYSTAGYNEEKSAREDRRLPAQIAADEARANASNADARLKDRTDPNIRKSGDGPPAGVLDMDASTRTQLTQAVSSTMSLTDSMEDLSMIYRSAVGRAAAGELGAGENAVTQFFSGVQSYFDSKGTSKPRATWGYTKMVDAAGNELDISIEDKVQQRSKDFERMARSLNVNKVVLESLVIDAAYALARAREPGGRLSNNDFDYALAQLGAVQDPESALAAFAAIEQRAYKQTLDRFTPWTDEGIKFHGFDTALSRLKERHEEFQKRRGGFLYNEEAPPAGDSGPGPKGATARPRARTGPGGPGRGRSIAPAAAVAAVKADPSKRGEFYRKYGYYPD